MCLLQYIIIVCLGSEDMMCVNSKGAAQLLGVTTVTVWRWCISRRLHSFPYGIHTLIPLRDIAKELHTNQKELLRKADSYDIPIWRCKK